MSSVRLSVCLNASQSKGQSQAALLLPAPHSTEALLAAAANKLRLKKKEVERAQLYVWKTGVKLPRGQTCGHLLRNDDLIAISVGEAYAGPVALEGTSPSALASAPAVTAERLEAPVVVGRDDMGRSYDSLAELWEDQAVRYVEYYEANARWWDADGYGGSADEEAMIGDCRSEEDVAQSLEFLDAVRGSRPHLRLERALDGGAGVGRVTKHVLLRRCENVCLVEPCERWLKQARRYLGNKRAQRCSFVCERLEEYVPPVGAFDLVWVQWCLQYLVDAHVVIALSNLRRGLSAHGVILLKENRPSGAGIDQRAFYVDMPHGQHQRYDVTRPDDHHRWLFSCAGLEVEHCAPYDEVNCWVLRPASNLPKKLPPSRALPTHHSSEGNRKYKLLVTEIDGMDSPWMNVEAEAQDEEGNNRPA
ncbi:hypothetical protein AB1Y20_019993 [Prymnesium parvum]|uniref:Alpha N-terminal protein methyltransferase 1 n=1 Tax=Prymnesium parvum TaxID=97485 RepID=A0AB34JWP2_PRYPA